MFIEGTIPELINTFRSDEGSNGFPLEDEGSRTTRGDVLRSIGVWLQSGLDRYISSLIDNREINNFTNDGWTGKMEGIDIQRFIYSVYPESPTITFSHSLLTNSM